MRSPDDPPLADVEAFVALYREHAEALLVFFARRTLDAEAAADLTAETFAQARRRASASECRCAPSCRTTISSASTS